MGLTETFLNVPFDCHNISAYLNLNGLLSAIVYYYPDVIYSHCFLTGNCDDYNKKLNLTFEWKLFHSNCVENFQQLKDMVG